MPSRVNSIDMEITGKLARLSFEIGAVLPIPVKQDKRLSLPLFYEIVLYVHFLGLCCKDTLFSRKMKAEVK